MSIIDLVTIAVLQDIIGQTFADIYISGEIFVFWYVFISILSIIALIVWLFYKEYKNSVNTKKEELDALFMQYQNASKDLDQQLKIIKSKNNILHDYIDKKWELSIFEIKRFIEYILPSNSSIDSISINKDKNTFVYTTDNFNDLLRLLKKLKEYEGKYISNIEWKKINLTNKLIYSASIWFDVKKVRLYLVQNSLLAQDIQLKSYYDLYVYNISDSIKTIEIEEDKKDNSTWTWTNITIKTDIKIKDELIIKAIMGNDYVENKNNAVDDTEIIKVIMWSV